MPEYILFMHDDALADEQSWEPYIRRLQQSGRFEGGSADRLHRVNADSLDQARSLLIGNPHFEAGGTVEIRELPGTD
jgi:hypothetical protein